MLRYGKMVQTAVSVTSRLAELYHQKDALVSSLDISVNRNIPKPAVAKVLTILAKHGYVTGSPGPGGGYKLAKNPKKITLFDIVNIFEKSTERPCPLGPGACSTRKNGETCVLHDRFIQVIEGNEKFLKTTHFGYFANEGPSAK